MKHESDYARDRGLISPRLTEESKTRPGRFSPERAFAWLLAEELDTVVDETGTARRRVRPWGWDLD